MKLKDHRLKPDGMKVRPDVDRLKLKNHRLKPDGMKARSEMRFYFNLGSILTCSGCV